MGMSLALGAVLNHTLGLQEISLILGTLPFPHFLPLKLWGRGLG